MLHRTESVSRKIKFKIGKSDHSAMRHFVDEVEQFFPRIGSIEKQWEGFLIFPVLKSEF